MAAVFALEHAVGNDRGGGCATDAAALWTVAGAHGRAAGEAEATKGGAIGQVGATDGVGAIPRAAHLKALNGGDGGAVDAAHGHGIGDRNPAQAVTVVRGDVNVVSAGVVNPIHDEDEVAVGGGGHRVLDGVGRAQYVAVGRGGVGAVQVHVERGGRGVEGEEEAKDGCQQVFARRHSCLGLIEPVSFGLTAVEKRE